MGKVADSGFRALPGNGALQAEVHFAALLGAVCLAASIADRIEIGAQGC